MMMMIMIMIMIMMMMDNDICIKCINQIAFVYIV